MSNISNSLFQTEVEVYTDGVSKYVRLHQPLFINKIREISWFYSLDFSDYEIVKDLNRSCKFKDEYFKLKSKSR